MLHGKIDTEGLEFMPRLEDVETLNQLAIEGALDITKVSYGVVFQLLGQYRILEAGGALGKGVGPLFVSKNIVHDGEIDCSKIRVALPGINTTAHLLFSLAYPQIKNKTFVPFHVIEEMVINGAVDAGVIIHENRFTYQQKGSTNFQTWEMFGKNGQVHPSHSGASWSEDRSTLILPPKSTG
jgi:1,4-dihydroxy-6-naphthoate synthase